MITQIQKKCTSSKFEAIKMGINVKLTGGYTPEMKY